MKKNLTKLGLSILVVGSKTFTFMCLWNWFFTPLGLPVVTYILALGVMLTVNFLTMDEWTHTETPSSKEMVGAAVVYQIITFFSYLVHLLYLAV